MVMAVRFCGRCGAQQGALAADRPGDNGSIQGNRLLFMAVLGMAAIGALGWARRPSRPVSNSAAPLPERPNATVPPDLSTMTPRRQFALLTDRIERAMASGDSGTVVQFYPMAEAAFAALSPADRDKDARFHAALSRIRIGHPAAAVAEIDTLRAGAQFHLLASYLEAIADDLNKNPAGAIAARQAFRDHFEAEIASDRPEYRLHRDLLDQFLASIEGGPGN